MVESQEGLKHGVDVVIDVAVFVTDVESQEGLKPAFHNDVVHKLLCIAGRISRRVETEITPKLGEYVHDMYEVESQEGLKRCTSAQWGCRSSGASVESQEGLKQNHHGEHERPHRPHRGRISRRVETVSGRVALPIYAVYVSRISRRVETCIALYATSAAVAKAVESQEGLKRD